MLYFTATKRKRIRKPEITVMISFLECFSFKNRIARITVTSISDVQRIFATFMGTYLYENRRLQAQTHISIPQMLGGISFFIGISRIFFGNLKWFLIIIIIAVPMDHIYTVNIVITKSYRPSNGTCDGKDISKELVLISISSGFICYVHYESNEEKSQECLEWWQDFAVSI